MSNAFKETHLQTLLETWNDDYNLKKHDGEIRGLELTKKYMITPDTNASDTARFVINVTRLYKYMSCKKEGDTITLSVSVKPDTVEEFLAFHKNLMVEESQMQRV